MSSLATTFKTYYKLLLHAFSCVARVSVVTDLHLNLDLPHSWSQVPNGPLHMSCLEGPLHPFLLLTHQTRYPAFNCPSPTHSINAHFSCCGTISQCPRIDISIKCLCKCTQRSTVPLDVIHKDSLRNNCIALPNGSCMSGLVAENMQGQAIWHDCMHVHGDMTTACKV